MEASSIATAAPLSEEAEPSPAPSPTRGRLVVVGCACFALLAGFGLAVTHPWEAEAPSAVTEQIQRPTTLHPPATVGASWDVVVQGSSGPAVATAAFDSGEVVVMWLSPQELNFRYVPGYEVPGLGPRTAADSDPSTWVPGLAAAFNGGFQLSDGAGGYYNRGETPVPLKDGYAAFEVREDGTMSVGVTGRGISVEPQTVAIRQNLEPLVVDGVSQASTEDSSSRWGLADGGASRANRSAVGELADGAIVFAYGHEVRADTVADALVEVGARTAMVLDMNKSWPTGFYYRQQAGETIGERIQPNIVREPQTYLESFKKDFVAARLKGIH